MSFIDLRNNRQFVFHAKDIFLVSIRRSNGNPKPLYTGLDAKKAFTIYHDIKVFKNDRKFLKIKRVSEVNEIEVYAESGKDEKVKSFRGYSIRPNYKRKILQNITNIPITCYEDFKAIVETHVNESGNIMSVNKLIPLLMANFASLTREEQLQLINSAIKVMAKHKILSGGDNTREIKKTLIEEQENQEDDLL